MGGLIPILVVVAKGEMLHREVDPSAQSRLTLQGCPKASSDLRRGPIQRLVLLGMSVCPTSRAWFITDDIALRPEGI